MRPIRRMVYLAFFMAVLLSNLIWARAGGGEGFSDGSGGGYSHDGGGGGGITFHSDPWDGGGRGNSHRGGSIPLPVALFLIVVIVIAFWMYSKYGHKWNRSSGLGKLPQWNQPQSTHWSQAALQVLAKANRSTLPALEAKRLVSALPQLFIDIQNAWSQRKLEFVHRTLSDGMFSRWHIQLEMHRREGRKNILANPQLLNAEAIAYHRQGDYESLDVLIRGSLIDLDLRQEDSLPATLPSPSAFEEIWSWTRLFRKGQTLMATPPQTNSQETFASQCLNCGADTTHTQGVKCQHCGAILNSGAYDWVLAEITQLNAQDVGLFRQKKSNSLPATLPGLSIQEMEDRASTVFVRLVESALDAKPGRMRPYASDDFIHRLSQKGGAFGNQSLQRLSIGSVETLSLEEAEGIYSARVKVLYSTSRNTMLVTPEVHATTLVFSKTNTPGNAHIGSENPEGIRTEGFNSLNCPQCGAPIGHSEQARCEYCGETLNDVHHHWVLTDLESLTKD